MEEKIPPLLRKRGFFTVYVICCLIGALCGAELLRRPPETQSCNYFRALLRTWGRQALIALGSCLYCSSCRLLYSQEASLTPQRRRKWRQERQGEEWDHDTAWRTRCDRDRQCAMELIRLITAEISKGLERRHAGPPCMWKGHKSSTTGHVVAVWRGRGRFLRLTVPFPAMAADGQTCDGVSGDPWRGGRDLDLDGPRAFFIGLQSSATEGRLDGVSHLFEHTQRRFNHRYKRSFLKDKQIALQCDVLPFE